MKFLFRSTLLLALLASLAYGSYAFGRHVLSHYLFAQGVKANPGSVVGEAMASSVDGGVTEGSYKGSKAQADVRVLSAAADGAGPQAPSSEALERETRSTSTGSGTSVEARPTPPPPSSVPQDSNRAQDGREGRSRSGDRNDVLTGGYRGSLRPDEDEEDGSSRRRRRRSRRRRDYSRDRGEETRSQSNTDTDRGASSSDGGSNASINDRPVSEEPRRAAPRVDQPRSEPRRSEPRRSEPRPPARRVPSNDSPIPAPERGGGDSPVPVPE